MAPLLQVKDLRTLLLYRGRRRQGRRRHYLRRRGRRDAWPSSASPGCGKSVSALSHPPPDSHSARPDRRRRDHLRRRRPPQAQRRGDPPHPRQRDRHGLPGPDDLAQPCTDHRPADRPRPSSSISSWTRTRRRKRAVELLEMVGIADGRAPPRRLSRTSSPAVCASA